MIEYLFFNREVSDRFTEVLKQRGLEWAEEIEPVQNAISIKISEGLDDGLWDEIDDIYDEYSMDDQVMMESGMVDIDSASTAGIYLQLKNGEQTIAKVDPDVMNKILSVISIEELNSFIEGIVSSVETPDDSPICKTS